MVFVTTIFIKLQPLDDNMLIKIYENVCNDDKCNSLVNQCKSENNSTNTVCRMTIRNLLEKHCKNNNDPECELCNNHIRVTKFNTIMALMNWSSFFVLFALYLF